MSTVKRDNWTEADVTALPTGEHDYFDRKSGQLFDGDRGELLAAIAKATSAFANSGGGHLILGVKDDGVPDGVPPMQGRTSTRDWLEQQVPNLVAYPLADFRVHVVARSTPSAIPQGRDLIVIDYGDSALAPHQCLRSGSGVSRFTYYYRQAGRSEPAPHFYLELLRQRLVSPVLELKSLSLTPGTLLAQADAVFLPITLRLTLENIGRVAAYKWQIVYGLLLPDDSRRGDVVLGRESFPSGVPQSSGGIRLDDTILPGSTFTHDLDLGVFLRPSYREPQEVAGEIDRMVAALTLRYRIATEASRGDQHELPLRDYVDVRDLTLRYLQGPSPH